MCPGQSCFLPVPIFVFTMRKEPLFIGKETITVDAPGNLMTLGETAAFLEKAPPWRLLPWNYLMLFLSSKFLRDLISSEYNGKLLTNLLLILSLKWQLTVEWHCHKQLNNVDRICRGGI